jgi:uncharacterized protein YcgL (UPF0745 family)
MTPGQIHCSVYKCNRKSNYFLYVERAEEFSRVPESLLAMLGELQHVIDLQLDDQIKLAQADVQLVMQQLRESGYYLQMPLDSESKRPQ